MKFKIVLALGLFMSIRSFAQWECRSHLAANFKPLYSGSNIQWGAELIGSAGYLTNSEIANSMVFGGIDYSIGNHQLYLEGGLKYWYNQNLDLGYTFTKSRMGLREVSYNYTAPAFDFRLGLHQMNVSDYFLVNERAWGASIGKNVGDFSLNVTVATVTNDFSRNGVFCSTGFLYDIVPARNYPLGHAWGDTNFASLSFRKKISTKKAEEITDEDGFETFEPITDSDAGAGIELKSWGGLIYSEYGNYYVKSQLYGGLMSEIGMGRGLNIKVEGIYQQVSDNRAFLFYLQAEKEKAWNSEHLSTLQFLFLGKKDFDENAVAMPRFSNLFLGEVFRMDVVDMPLIHLSVKHQFINQKLSLKLNYIRQLQGTQMEEFDFSVGKFLLDKHLRVTALTGLMNTSEFTNWSKLARVEVRIFF